MRIRIKRVEKALQSTLQTMRAMQLEAEINCMLNALLKGIAGALIEAQFNDRRQEAQSDYTAYLSMMNEWRKLDLSLFHISKDRLKDTNQRIIEFDALKSKLYEFFYDDQSISAIMLSDFTDTYENYVRRRPEQQNRKIKIQNRIGLYIFLLTRQGLSNKKI